MAKQRRHQSSKPRRRPVHAPKPKKRRSLKAVSSDRAEAELYRQLAPGLSAKNRKALKQRMDILAKYYKPLEGETTKVTFDLSSGRATKTFYDSGGTEKRTTEITPEGKIPMGSMEWITSHQGAGGLVNICGTPDVPFAAQAFECVPEDHPLAQCCSGNEIALCCVEGLKAEAEISCASSACSNVPSSLSYDTVDQKWKGPWPLQMDLAPPGRQLHFWCDNAELRESDGTLVEVLSLNTVNSDCGSFEVELSGSFELDCCGAMNPPTVIRITTES